MKHYTVKFELEIQAEDPKHAAQKALDAILLQDIRFFEVKDEMTGKTSIHDLSDRQTIPA